MVRVQEVRSAARSLGNLVYGDGVLPAADNVNGQSRLYVTDVPPRPQATGNGRGITDVTQGGSALGDLVALIE